MNTLSNTQTSFTELKDSFTLYLSKQKTINFYPSEFTPFRSQLVEWLIFLCENLSFKPETLFRSILIFDQYISKCHRKILFNFFELKLITVACLSLATKIEEINCNYLVFLTDKVLNSENDQNYTAEKLASKEIEILKGLNFNTNYSTPFHFISILHSISEEVYGNETEEYYNIVNMSIFFLTQAIKSEESIFVPSKDLALFAFNQALIQLRTNGPMRHSEIVAVWSKVQKLTMPQKEQSGFGSHNGNIRVFRRNSDDITSIVFNEVA